MANEVRIHASVKDDVSQPLTGIRQKIGHLSEDAKKSVLTGVGLGAGVSAFGLLERGVRGAVGVISDSIDKARDLNETINKSQVVFGAAAEGIQAWGLTSAKSMGLSEQAAIEAAASIGNLLLSTGTAKDKIAPMSEGLVQLASDLASFNNIDPTEALDKLRSGLVGQERPLRELGVAISAASVDIEAAALGFKKVNGEFTEGEKVQARYSLIFKQTATAHGDFARTSTALANSQRILNAEWDNAQAKLGQSLLPVVTQAVHGLISLVDVITQMGDLTPVIIGLGAAFAVMLGPVIIANAPLILLAGAVALVAANLGSLKPIIDVVAESIGTLADAARLLASPLGNLNDLIGSIPVPWHKAADAVQHSADQIATVTKELAAAPDQLAEHFRTSSPSMDKAATTMLAPIGDEMDAARKDAVASAKKTPGEIASGLISGYDDVENAAQDLRDALLHPISGAKRLVHLQALLTGKQMAAGLHSSDPLIRARAEAWREKIRAEIAAIHAYSAGQGVGFNFAAGMTSALFAVDASAQRLADAARSNLRTRSPAKRGPLSEDGGPEGWGKRIGLLLGKGMDATMPNVGAMLGRPLRAIGSGGMAPAMAMAGGGLTINIHGVSVLTPGAAEALAHQIGPLLSRWQQRQGLIPR